MAGPYRVTVYDDRLYGMFLPNGEAWDWLQDVGVEHLRQSIAMTPTRSGHLKSAFYVRPIMTPYGRGLGSRYTIRNDAYYARFVAEGTKTPIRSPRGGWMSIPAWGGYRAFRAKTVRGQQANNWIEEAWDVVGARYGV